ncbi:MAG: GNAT family N-acetyltransferase [Planctomycetes bacterium]|nr:GNAT family N-acetyltransferase [Planctomycetota bacterium]
MTEHLRVAPMTKELADDWIDFFDHRAFEDNAAWSGCYCRVFEFPHETESWDEACANNANRDVMAAAANAGDVQGFLAYDDDVVVGWCRSGVRTMFRRGHSGVRETPPEGDSSTLCTVCFVVAPTHRRRGVARALLTAACEQAGRDGLAAVEGYALKELPTDRELPPEAELFRGPRGLYAHLGFDVAGETDRYWIMRKTLASH